MSQIRVLASDGGTPPRTDTTVVTVNVQRNLIKPEFDPREYTASILETQPLGVPFAQVRGRDRDQRVSSKISTVSLVADLYAKMHWASSCVNSLKGRDENSRKLNSLNLSSVIVSMFLV